jgi:hypothetical protein
MDEKITVLSISQALRQTFLRFDYLVAAEIADAAGMGEDELSKIRNGHKDLYSARMFRILNALPEEPKIYFLAKLGVLRYRDRPCDFLRLSGVMTSLYLSESIAAAQCIN